MTYCALMEFFIIISLVFSLLTLGDEAPTDIHGEGAVESAQPQISEPAKPLETILDFSPDPSKLGMYLGADTIPVYAGEQTPATDCDRLAAGLYDPHKPTSLEGLASYDVNPELAIEPCLAALQDHPTSLRLTFSLARAYANTWESVAAFEHFKTAARAGYPAALSELGDLLMYYRDLDPQNLELALNAYVLASERGYWEAAQTLGIAYWQEGDPKTAFTWIHKAAHGGHGPAMGYVAQFMEDPYDSHYNPDLALSWFRAGMAKRDATSLEGLGFRYFDGQQVEQDKVRGLDFLFVAAAFDPDNAYLRSRNLRGEIARQTQLRLKKLGLYQGPLDGEYSDALDTAIWVWSDQKGDPEALFAWLVETEPNGGTEAVTETAQ